MIRGITSGKRREFVGKKKSKKKFQKKMMKRNVFVGKLFLDVSGFSAQINISAEDQIGIIWNVQGSKPKISNSWKKKSSFVSHVREDTGKMKVEDPQEREEKMIEYPMILIISNIKL